MTTENKIEQLLEDWKEGNYYEVSEAVSALPPNEVVDFCNLLTKYCGPAQLVVLSKLMN